MLLFCSVDLETNSVVIYDLYKCAQSDVLREMNANHGIQSWQFTAAKAIFRYCFHIS